MNGLSRMESLSRSEWESERPNLSGQIEFADDFVVDVLVIEDDDDSRVAIAELLDGAGYAVAVVGNGQEALDLVSGGLRPRLVMTDLRMPVMDGWELLAIRPAHPVLSEVPVLVVSGEAERPLFRRGVCGLVQKPVDVDRFLALVEETLAPAC